jgi:hypothetical protein
MSTLAAWPNAAIFEGQTSRRFVSGNAYLRNSGGSKRFDWIVEACHGANGSVTGAGLEPAWGRPLAPRARAFGKAIP